MESLSPPAIDPVLLAEEEAAYAWIQRVHLGGMALRLAYGGDPAAFGAEAEDHAGARAFAAVSGHELDAVLAGIQALMGKLAPPMFS